jgi:hypothetical protein
VIAGAIKAQGDAWTAATMADPDLGPNVAKIQVDVARALDALGDPKLKTDFQHAMNDTMVGSHPAFVKTFWKLAQKVGEGGPVMGGGPSALGQTPTGRVEKPSLAAAMYPNLVSKAS